MGRAGKRYGNRNRDNVLSRSNADTAAIVQSRSDDRIEPRARGSWWQPKSEIAEQRRRLLLYVAVAASQLSWRASCLGLTLEALCRRRFPTELRNESRKSPIGFEGERADCHRAESGTTGSC